MYGAISSAGSEHLVYTERVGGSNPSLPTFFLNFNLLPWALLQGGGMLLIALLTVCPATRKPIAGGWGIPLGAVIALYALAKVFELADHAVFDLTQNVVSGHSLKHIVAALAAWPVIQVMHNRATAH